MRAQRVSNENSHSNQLTKLTQTSQQTNFGWDCACQVVVIQTQVICRMEIQIWVALGFTWFTIDVAVIKIKAYPSSSVNLSRMGLFLSTYCAKVQMFLLMTMQMEHETELALDLPVELQNQTPTLLT